MENKKAGISIGTTDSFNTIENCDIHDNGGPGIDIRREPWPSKVHSCMFRGCRISGNSHVMGRGQIEISGDAENMIIEGNILDGNNLTYGIITNDEVKNVFVDSNKFIGCKAKVYGDGFTDSRPNIESGHSSSTPKHYRHLVGNQRLT